MRHSAYCGCAFDTEDRNNTHGGRPHIHYCAEHARREDTFDFDFLHGLGVELLLVSLERDIARYAEGPFKGGMETAIEEIRERMHVEGGRSE